MVDRTRSITYEAYDRNVFSKKKFRNAPNAIQCHVKRKDKSHDVNRKAFRFNVKAPICCWCVYFLEVENVSLKDSSLRLGAAKWIQNDREIVLKWIYSHLLLNLNIFIFALFPFSTIAQCFCRSFTEQLMRFTKRTFYLLPFIPIRSLFWLTKINCSRSHLFGCVYVRKMENRSLCRLLSEDSQMIFSCSGIYIYIYIAWISNGCIFGWVYRTTIHTELYLYRTHHCERVRMNFELKSGRSLGVLCF